MRMTNLLRYTKLKFLTKVCETIVNRQSWKFHFNGTETAIETCSTKQLICICVQQIRKFCVTHFIYKKFATFSNEALLKLNDFTGMIK